MNEVADRIICPGCSRGYRWKPELAGRTAKCKCGGSVQFPQEKPAEAGSAELDFAPAPGTPRGKSSPAPQISVPVGGVLCKGCRSPLAENAILCTSCGMNQRTGKKLGTAIDGPPAGSREREPSAPSKAPKPLHWITAAIGVLALAAATAFVVPSIAETVCLGIIIVGAIVSFVGSVWAILAATADNMGIRVLCILIGIVALVVVIWKSVTDWQEMKAPMLTWFSGWAIIAVGVVLALMTSPLLE